MLRGKSEPILQGTFLFWLAVILSNPTLLVGAEGRLPFRPAHDTTKAILLSLSSWRPMREVQFQLSIALGRRGVPLYLTAEDSDYRDLLQRFHSHGLQPGLVHRIPVKWNGGGWARDYGPAFLSSPTRNDWLILPFTSKTESNADWEVSRYLSDELKIPILPPVSSTLSSAQGNLLVDDKHRCYTTGPDFKDPFLLKNFACSEIIRFPCRSTNCHIDENLVFLKGDSVITDQSDFIELLKRKVSGSVLLVPAVDQLPLTNVLIVNGVVFLLSAEDAVREVREAQKAYESLGYTVQLIETRERLGGGLHCITKEIPT